MAVIGVFEDKFYRDLLPLVYCRPVYEVRCGMSSLLEKIARRYPGQKIVLLCREHLAATLRERTDLPVNALPAGEDVLFVNGRMVMREAIPLDGPEEVAMSGGTLVYARLRAGTAAAIQPADLLSGSVSEKLPHTMRHAHCKADLVRYYWDVVDHNEAELVRDFEELAPAGENHGKVYEGAHLLAPGNIFIGEGASIKPCCVLDAEGGPIYIGEGATVMPNSTIIGPAYIGRKSKIQMASRLHEGSNIGEVCKVGGEIENSIMHSFSNKQHDGFLGHAYIGQWVNLAADTINSDLKNTYGTVRVQLPHKLVETDSMFVGLAVGDHSKSAIASQFITGSVVGFNCNVLASGFPPKLTPSFTWLTDAGSQPYSATMAVEVARRVLSRRDHVLTDAGVALFHKLFDMTQAERDTIGLEE